MINHDTQSHIKSQHMALHSVKIQSFLGVLFKAKSRSIALTHNIIINSLMCYTHYLLREYGTGFKRYHHDVSYVVISRYRVMANLSCLIPYSKLSLVTQSRQSRPFWIIGDLMIFPLLVLYYSSFDVCSRIA